MIIAIYLADIKNTSKSNHVFKHHVYRDQQPNGAIDFK